MNVVIMLDDHDAICHQGIIAKRSQWNISVALIQSQLGLIHVTVDTPHFALEV